MNIIVSFVKKIRHDHMHATQSGSVCTSDIHENGNSSGHFPELSQAAELTTEEALSRLHLDDEQRSVLEESTRAQSATPLWFHAQENCSTGSKCGRIIEQRWKTNALLQFVIYPNSMLPLHLPKVKQWDRENERKACHACQEYKENNGHRDFKVNQAGFVVHETKGWFRASLDGWVMDLSYDPSNGNARDQVSILKADNIPEEISKDEGLSFRLVDGVCQLDKKHQYYHQVELQLLVTFDTAKLCDICVFMLKGVCVQRIFPDEGSREEIST